MVQIHYNTGGNLQKEYLRFNPISTEGRCVPPKFCLPVDNFFSFGSIATKFGDHNDPLLYKILVKVNSDHLDCNPGISPDIKDFKFPAIIISVWYLHFR